MQLPMQPNPGFDHRVTVGNTEQRQLHKLDVTVYNDSPIPYSSPEIRDISSCLLRLTPQCNAFCKLTQVSRNFPPMKFSTHMQRCLHVLKFALTMFCYGCSSLLSPCCPMKHSIFPVRANICTMCPKFKSLHYIICNQKYQFKFHSGELFMQISTNENNPLYSNSSMHLSYAVPRNYVCLLAVYYLHMLTFIFNSRSQS